MGLHGFGGRGPQRRAVFAWLGGGRLAWIMTLVLLPSPLPRAQETPTTNDFVVKLPGTKIDVTLPDDTMKLTPQELLCWVKGSACVVANYYGRFPVPHLTLRVRGSYGSGIRHGVTYPRDGC